MQIYKFGGASIKDVQAIENVASIIKEDSAHVEFVVISAMGKTTNALESALHQYLEDETNNKNALRAIWDQHIELCKKLLNESTYNTIIAHLEELYAETCQFLIQHKKSAYTFLYDRVISCGELLSTRIMAAYLQQQGIACHWIDARTIIYTDSQHTEARVDFAKTQPFVNELLKKPGIKIIQGFIGSDAQGNTTTLGREGSDYSAAVLSYCADAEKMVIWKDVPAVLNADPRLFSDTIAIPHLSYREAIEMTYYGAQVIHPKTIKPIQNKHIPLHVRSFLDKNAPGTLIADVEGDNKITYPPIIVYKTNQVLISVSVKDFSFVAEDQLSKIYAAFSNSGLRMNLSHSGAISFNASVDFKEDRLKLVIEALSIEFDIRYNESVQLLTIRHYNEETIEKLTKNKTILLTHKTRNTIQILMRDKE